MAKDLLQIKTEINRNAPEEKIEYEMKNKLEMLVKEIMI